jgi:preprotein translocase subunit SecD
MLSNIISPMNIMRRGIKMRTKVKSTIIFIIFVLLIGIIGYIGSYGLNTGSYVVKSLGQTINRGLDLQGGVSILEEIVSTEKVSTETLERTKELLSTRVNKMGVSETSVTIEGENRIRIDIPGKFDAKSINETLVKTGKLTFKDPSGNELLTGSDVNKATASVDEKAQPIISLEMNEEGTKKFADATQKFIGQKISIYMDEELLTDPVVNTAITDGKAIITGNRTLDEAKRIAAMIQSGALPVELKAVSVRTVGATLGNDAIPNSLKAGVVGIGIILLFMIAYYRVPGLLADIALVFFIISVLFTFVFLKVTLTLPGIAAFLLTVGMAVDANVLIFERIKEELKAGKSVKSAVDSGFNRALSSILDSNITTIIAGIVLYYLGSGAVKGFALTLMIGIVLSMFSAIVVTKFLVKLALNMGIMNKPSLFGVKRG